MYELKVRKEKESMNCKINTNKKKYTTQKIILEEIEYEKNGERSKKKQKKQNRKKNILNDKKKYLRKK